MQGTTQELAQKMILHAANASTFADKNDVWECAYHLDAVKELAQFALDQLIEQNKAKD